MSLTSPAAPEPVLSPTRHPAGSPARIRSSPVVLAVSQPVSRSRPAGASPSSRTVEPVVQDELAQVRDHPRGRGGVALVAGSADVEVGLDPVQAGHVVAEGPDERRHGLRSAQDLQQQVVGGVVAAGDGGLAERGDGHAVGDVLGGDRGVGQQFRLVVADQPVQVHAGAQDRRGDQRLVRGAHQEPLVGPVRHRRPGAGVHRVHPDPAAEPGLQRGEVRRGGGLPDEPGAVGSGLAAHPASTVPRPPSTNVRRVIRWPLRGMGPLVVSTALPTHVRTRTNRSCSSGADVG